MLDQLDGSLGEKDLSRIAVPPTAVKAWAALVRLNPCRQDVQPALAPCLGFGTAMVRTTPSPETRDQHIGVSPTWTSWSKLAKGYASCERFLTELSLDPPDATDGINPTSGEDYVVLSPFTRPKAASGRLFGF